MCVESYKAFLQDSEKKQINENASHVYGLESLTLLKYTYSPKWSVGSTKSLSKSYWHYFRNREKVLKFIWGHKGPQNSQNNLEKEHQCWRPHTLRFQNKLSYTWSSGLWQGGQGIQWGSNFLLISVLRKLDINMQKNEAGFLP